MVLFVGRASSEFEYTPVKWKTGPNALTFPTSAEPPQLSLLVMTGSPKTLAQNQNFSLQHGNEMDDWD